MLNIVGYVAIQNGHAEYYHAACLLRVRMYDGPTMPEIETCSPVMRGDLREAQPCRVCQRRLVDRAAVQSGADEDALQRRIVPRPAAPPTDDDPV